MIQQGQVFKLKATGVDGEPLWAYRYRVAGPSFPVFAPPAEVESGSGLPRGATGRATSCGPRVRRAWRFLWSQKGGDPSLTIARRLAVGFLSTTVVRAQSSAHRLLHERDDLFFFGAGQLFEREGGRPHVAFVEVAVALKPNVAYL
jgi:hypothetical protein